MSAIDRLTAHLASRQPKPCDQSSVPRLRPKRVRARQFRTADLEAVTVAMQQVIALHDQLGDTPSNDTDPVTLWEQIGVILDPVVR